MIYVYASNFSCEGTVVSTVLNSEDAKTSFCKYKNQKWEQGRNKRELKKQKERQKQAEKQGPTETKYYESLHKFTCEQDHESIDEKKEKAECEKC
jgi:hypothetical protein